MAGHLQGSLKQPSGCCARAKPEHEFSPAHPREALQQRMLVTLLTVTFYYYPSILTTTLRLFTCYQLDTPSDAVKYYDNARVRFCLCCLPCVNSKHDAAEHNCCEMFQLVAAVKHGSTIAALSRSALWAYLLSGTSQLVLGCSRARCMNLGWRFTQSNTKATMHFHCHETDSITHLYDKAT